MNLRQPAAGLIAVASVVSLTVGLEHQPRETKTAAAMRERSGKPGRGPAAARDQAPAPARATEKSVGVELAETRRLLGNARNEIVQLRAELERVKRTAARKSAADRYSSVQAKRDRLKKHAGELKLELADQRKTKSRLAAEAEKVTWQLATEQQRQQALASDVQKLTEQLASATSTQTSLAKDINKLRRELTDALARKVAAAAAREDKPKIKKGPEDKKKAKAEARAKKKADSKKDAAKKKPDAKKKKK